MWMVLVHLMLVLMFIVIFLKSLVVLLLVVVERFFDCVVVCYRVGGDWYDVIFVEVFEIVIEIVLGLLVLGVVFGECVVLLCETCLEWTYCDFVITFVGVVVVSIYLTSLLEECEWVLVDLGVVVVIVETSVQVMLVRALRGSLFALRDVVVIDVFDVLWVRASGVEVEEFVVRGAAVVFEDFYTIIYILGTIGRVKGCVLMYGNYCAMLEMVRVGCLLGGLDDFIYLYFLFVYVFGLLMMLWSLEIGGVVVYASGLDWLLVDFVEVWLMFLFSVLCVFEKLYVVLGAGFVDDVVVVRVRGVLGGCVRKVLIGVVLIVFDILEFFWVCGVLLLEGYGMIEVAMGIAIVMLDAHWLGIVGYVLFGFEFWIVDDGEIFVCGLNVFVGYYGELLYLLDVWLHIGDFGVLDVDGFFIIIGCKKDIIIMVGGKNLVLVNLERDFKRFCYVFEVVMYGDWWLYFVVLIMLVVDVIVGWVWVCGLLEDVATLSVHLVVHAFFQVELDRVNVHYVCVVQIKRFVIFFYELTIVVGELILMLKVRCVVVNTCYVVILDVLYC